jgi:nicotinamide riboside transporter PnuC
MSWTWIITVASIVGVVLNIHKRRSCFYVWACTNFAWMMIDFYEGIYSQAALFAVYFVLAIYGLTKWCPACKKERDDGE